MKQLKSKCRVAAVQASPVLFNKEATVEKALTLIARAAEQNADIIIFPEAFIPAYPRGFSYGYIVGSRTMEGREDWKIYYDNSILVPGPETDALGKAAKEAGAYVCMGVTERDETTCTLYCTYLYFSPEGELIGTHRKMKPTGSERCIWGDGNKGSLTAVDTPYGAMGGLICWENYMPLARAALYQKGVTLYVAPTADNREEWQITMRHIALEGRCFVIGCNQYVTKSMYPDVFHYQKELDALPEELCPGGTCIVDPFGHYVAGPVWKKEEILFAELDMDLVPMSRMDFDPAGHYARPDILELIVHEK